MLTLLISLAYATEWQTPPQEVLDVLHAPMLPAVWTAPSGEHLLLADRVVYPPLADYAAGWHELAGMRVTATGHYHGRYGTTSPRILAVDGGGEAAPLAIPDGATLEQVSWTADGERFALSVKHDEQLTLWVGDVSGAVEQVDGVVLNPLLDAPMRWMPDQKRLLVRMIPERGDKPQPPSIPAGPKVAEGSGDVARSTYESRNLLKTAHDEALFEYFMTTQLAIVNPKNGKTTPVGDPGIYANSSYSPDGKYLLVERLTPPWSHDVGYYRFAHEVEIWNKKGEATSVATLPLADEVPTAGVAEGPRNFSWQATEPHTLYWVEALDGGDPMAEVEHRDKLMRLEAPFTEPAEEVFQLQHRYAGHSWTEDGTMVLTERERMKRWRYTHLLDVDTGKASLWFDLNENDRYNSPGSPEYRLLKNGRAVLHQEGDSVYFSGRGSTPEGDRPFLDLRSLKTGEVERLFRSPADKYESFIAFTGDAATFIKRTESATEVPNYQRATLGETIKAEQGEATRAHTAAPITQFEDPTPQLRQLQKRIVQYERADGVPLSFQLYLPPGYKEGDGPLPTVVYAYPLEYSDASTAGQVSGSSQRFDRMYGPSHLFFALQGYAVLHQTAMPMVGDPETVYDTFVPQLVADAEAAVKQAVEMGVADPKKIGVIGHSHGGLMVGHLLAHTDLFAAGIARSGSYNKTNQPFGYQSERRSLFEAREAYINASPTFVANQVNEPILIIHGDADSNPGTLTFQSEVFFQAVRGSGGTARLVLLPFEDHGYRAKESVEHVLWEQLQWFDTYLKQQ